MGGSVFNSEYILTPRMPPSVYFPTRDSLLDILRNSFYAHVQSPIEGPEKPDHGDIDIKVYSPLRSFTAIDVANAIGAKYSKRLGSNDHFAIPWPEDHDVQSEESANTESPEDGESLGIDVNTSVNHDSADGKDGVAVCSDPNLRTSKETFIQVDIEQVPSLASYHWSVFHHSHGDIWNILGVLIRKKGLTASYSGIYIRIQEIELHNKNAARVLLTADPRAALDFFGLDYDRFWYPFKTKKEFFEYCGTCRFYDPNRFEDQEDLKSNDRQRARKRSLFREWFDEYLPSNRDGKKGEWAGKTREEMISISTEWFGIGEEFEDRKKEWIPRIEGERLWTEIRTALPLEGTRKGIVMKGLKREIAALGKDLSQEEECPDTEARQWFRDCNYAAVKTWALAHWEEVERRQTQIDKVACAKYFQAKAEEKLAPLIDEMNKSRIVIDRPGSS